MPREFIPLIRRGGFESAEKFYILAFEGTVTERKYFEDLRASEYFNDSGLIETIPLRRGLRDGNSPVDVKALLSKTKREYNFRPTDEFWLIIDRDDWERIHKIDLNTVVEDRLRENNFHMALSNPCFEIWLILHLARISDFTEDVQQKIFENAPVSYKKNFIDVVLADLIGDGRGYNKRPNPEVFLPRVYDAIAHAEEIADNESAYPKGIGTDVYMLVKRITKQREEA